MRGKKIAAPPLEESMEVMVEEIFLFLSTELAVEERLEEQFLMEEAGAVHWLLCCGSCCLKSPEGHCHP